MSSGTSASSNIRQVAEARRSGHLLSLNGFTGEGDNGQPVVDPVFLGFTLSTYLAWKDFEERRGGILPNLPGLIGDCDFHMSYEARDTQFSPIAAVNELLQSANMGTGATSAEVQPPTPFSIAGSLFSSVTQQVTTLAAGLEIPQISGTATIVAALRPLTVQIPMVWLRAWSM